MRNLIEMYVSLGGVSPSGWNNVKCNVCNDYKVRGGFHLTDERVTYHCFNCGIKASYFKHGRITNIMYEVLEAFGVPVDELKRLAFNNLGKIAEFKPKQITVDNPLVEQELPKNFVLLEEYTGPLREVYEEYLNSRKINNISGFYISLSNKTRFEKLWFGRLVIPFYREGKLVFYQGRSLEDVKLRYLNSAMNNSTVILYNYDEIFNKSEEPLFIVEGFFDAYHLNGIAINGNELTEKKIKIINQSKRRKIYIPDRYGNGKTAALNAIEAGWEVSIPDVGNCKDINEAIMQYGFMYVYRSLLQEAKNGFEAKVAINVKVKK
jgi:hypothetical protein